MTIAIGKLKEAARDLKTRIGGDPGKAREVLKAEGVLTAKGELTARYRKGSHQMAEYLHEATNGGKKAVAVTVVASKPSLKGVGARIVARRHPLKTK